MQAMAILAAVAKAHKGRAVVATPVMQQLCGAWGRDRESGDNQASSPRADGRRGRRRMRTGTSTPVRCHWRHEGGFRAKRGGRASGESVDTTHLGVNERQDPLQHATR